MLPQRFKDERLTRKMQLTGAPFGEIAMAGFIQRLVISMI